MNPENLDAILPETPSEPAAEESFADVLKAFESSHSHRTAGEKKQLEGTVISVSAERVFLDIGYKIEGVLPRTAFEKNADEVKAGDRFPVSIKGRSEDGYYELSRFKVAQPTDWSSLEAAFEAKTPIVATVSGVVKGGLTVDVGVRAFMPASRTGTRDAAEMEALVGTQITCRITKLDVADENVVVDRRGVLEEQAKAELEIRLSTINVGDTLPGTVRSLVPYGAFIDLGGFDGLLHVSDISHTRIAKPEDVLEVGQKLDVRILKIDPETKKLSLGLKQLQPEPWATVPERLKEGDRIQGTVSRLTDFGAFVEIEPGIEGLIHVSEMAWGRKVHHPSEVLKAGQSVEALILGIKPEERRISLGLKQTLADPWAEIPQKYPVGSAVEGPVTRLLNFGAFVQVAEGVEGLVHVSEIAPDKRVNHPSDELRVGQVVRAAVLAVDQERRQIKLSMKQLVPTSLDEFIAEHKVGDAVTGRVVEVNGATVWVELGEGIRAISQQVAEQVEESSAPAAGKVDLSALSSMLSARWKGNLPQAKSGPEQLAPGQIRGFAISKLDADAKKIEVKLA